MKQAIRHISIGIAMGTSDIIPGVSGGTIAFISGIYDKLITSLARINLTLWQYIRRGKRKKARQYIQGTFLVQLFVGIGLAIVLMSQLISHLLLVYPTSVFAFFFGIIIASVLYIAHHHLPKDIDSKKITLLIGGILLGGIMTFIAPHNYVDTSYTWIGIFFAGVVASMAMILPGISGSYILLLMGKYSAILSILKDTIQHIQQAYSTLSLTPLLTEVTGALVAFIGGVLTGLLGFSKLLHLVLHRRHTQTLLVLLGFMIGSVYSIRPWGTSLVSVTWRSSISICLLGGGIVYILHYITSKTCTKTTKKTIP